MRLIDPRIQAQRRPRRAGGWVWRLAVIMAVAIFLPAEVATSAASQPQRALVALPGNAPLAPAYSLAVVPVPPPPPRGTGAAALLGDACPLEVRAIVQGERAAASFAVIAVGGTSQVIRAGQSVVVGDANFVVGDMGAEQFNLQRGDIAIRCALAKRTR